MRSHANRHQDGGGAFFGASMLNWYLVLAILPYAVDFPILLGVSDLSQIVPGRSQIMAEKQRMQK
jgi:uncharacterized protein